MDGGDLHQGELRADEGVVVALLEAQVPDLAALPVRASRAIGTVNRVFRLGEALAVRLPRLPEGGDDLAREARVVPVVAPCLPVAVPEPRLLGEPVPGLFEARWAVVSWVEGAVPAAGEIPVDDLADAVLALRTADPGALPPAGRATADATDAFVRSSIAAMPADEHDVVSAAWEACRRAPLWDGVRVPIHADLLPPNLLVRDGRLAGILDWGGAGAGDPANDLVPAWSCLRGADRPRFRARVGADDGTWDRARGIALAQAIGAIPYYAVTNPRFAAMNRGTLAEVLADLR